MTTTKPYTSGATRAAHRLAEKLAADLKRLGPLRDTLAASRCVGNSGRLRRKERIDEHLAMEHDPQVA